MKKAFTFLIILFLLMVTKSFAQDSWYSPYKSKYQVNVEWIKPTFDYRPETRNRVTSLSSVLFITGLLQVDDKLRVHADIPLSHWGLKDGSGSDEQTPHTTIGNIYIGGTYQLPQISNSISPSVEIGLRLPTMPEPEFPDKLGSRTGFISSIDREEAFFDDLIPLQGYLNLDYPINDVAMIRVRGGASYWLTNKDINLENQLFLIQNMQINFETNEIGGSIGVSGRYHVFPKDDVFSNKTHIKATVTKPFNGWDIEFYLRTPIDHSGTIFFQKVYGIQTSINL